MTVEELTEEEEQELHLAESEAEAEAEFCMNFVNGGGLSSDWRQAWREHQMTDEEFSEHQAARVRAMHDADCFCRDCA